MPLLSSDPLPNSQICFYTPTRIARETFLYPLCIGHFWCDQRYFVDRSSYDSYLLMYVKDGSCYTKADGEAHMLVPGQVLILDCYLPHAYGTHGSLEFYWIHFDGPKAAGYLRYLLSCQNLPLTLLPAEALQLEELFQVLLSERSSTSLTEAQYDKYITDMLTLLSVSGSAKASPSDAANQAPAVIACQKAAGYMRQSFHTALSLEEIAAYVSLSPYYFIRCFKKYYGMTPHQYLTQLRLDCARFYLSTTQKTIGEIAFLCGFQSENNFCIAFKKQAGITPTCYRESL